MKQIVAVKPAETVITLGEVRKHLKSNCLKSYGVKLNESKGFITCFPHRTQWIVLSKEGLTIGNGWSSFIFLEAGKNYNLSSLIARLMEYDFQVFEFENESELFKWLAED